MESNITSNGSVVSPLLDTDSSSTPEYIIQQNFSTQPQQAAEILISSSTSEFDDLISALGRRAEIILLQDVSGEWVPVGEGERLYCSKVGTKNIVIIIRGESPLPDSFPEVLKKSLQIVGEKKPTFQIRSVQKYDGTSYEVLVTTNGTASAARFSMSANLLVNNNNEKFNVESCTFSIEIDQSNKPSSTIKSGKRPREEEGSKLTPSNYQEVTYVPGSLDVSRGYVKALSFIQVSDERLKTNITDITDALSIVSKLRGKRYEWKDPVHGTGVTGTNKVIGLIAQEVAKVLPEVVHEDPKTGYKSVAYMEILPVLVDAFNEFVAKCTEDEEREYWNIKRVEYDIEDLYNQVTKKMEDDKCLKMNVVLQNFINEYTSSYIEEMEEKVPIAQIRKEQLKTFGLWFFHLGICAIMTLLSVYIATRTFHHNSTGEAKETHSQYFNHDCIRMYGTMGKDWKLMNSCNDRDIDVSVFCYSVDDDAKCADEWKPNNLKWPQSVHLTASSNGTIPTITLATKCSYCALSTDTYGNPFSVTGYRYKGSALPQTIPVEYVQAVGSREMGWSVCATYGYFNPIKVRAICFGGDKCDEKQQELIIVPQNSTLTPLSNSQGCYFCGPINYVSAV